MVVELGDWIELILERNAFGVKKLVHLYAKNLSTTAAEKEGPRAYIHTYSQNRDNRTGTTARYITEMTDIVAKKPLDPGIFVPLLTLPSHPCFHF